MSRLMNTFTTALGWIMAALFCVLYLIAEDNANDYRRMTKESIAIIQQWEDINKKNEETIKIYTNLFKRLNSKFIVE